MERMITPLKYMRQQAGLTQKDLAERAHVNIRQIQHYEQGSHDINGASVVTVLCLAEALGCSVYDIINPRDFIRETPSK